jgi:hypothetical protein
MVLLCPEIIITVMQYYPLSLFFPTLSSEISRKIIFLNTLKTTLSKHFI